MKQRGRRKSGEIPRIGGERPQPPEDFDEFEAEIWSKLVDTKPPDWFTKDTHEILRSFCKSAGYVRKVDGWLAECEDREEFGKLSSMRHGILSKLYAAGRLMRVTQHSMYDADSAKRRTKPKYKPKWEQ